MSTWTRFIPVENMQDLREAMNFKLKVRRIGSDREGTIKECVGHHDGYVIIEYPEWECKWETTCKISNITNYEIEPRRKIETFLHQFSFMLGNSLTKSHAEIPRLEEDRPDIDFLGIFLENNTIARYLYCETKNQPVRGKIKKAKLLINQAIQYVISFAGKGVSNRTSEYATQASLRILFWCYYCKINDILSQGSQGKAIIESIANVMDNNSLPLAVRFRAARIIYFLGSKECGLIVRLPRFSQGYASCLLSEVAGLTQQHNSGANIGDEDKKIIQLARYDLADYTGKEPEYFY